MVPMNSAITKEYAIPFSPYPRATADATSKSRKLGIRICLASTVYLMSLKPRNEASNITFREVRGNEKVIILSTGMRAGFLNMLSATYGLRTNNSVHIATLRTNTKPMPQ